MVRHLGIAVFFFTLPNLAWPKVRVVTTTSTLADWVIQLGGEKVEVESITSGSQDPHHVEAKPSYMVKVRNADLFVRVGLELEDAWADKVIRGARSPKLMPGSPGHLELGRLIQPIGVLSGRVDRSHGDIHASGNPHFYLDPLRSADVMVAIGAKLAELDPDHSQHYQQSTARFTQLIKKKHQEWETRVKKTGIQKVITYHQSLNYFFERYGLKQAAELEPKPGIPPTAQHIVKLVKLIKDEKINCILVENFFDMTAVKRIQQSVSVKAVQVAVEVGALASVKDYLSLIEELVLAVESCAQTP